MAFVENLKWTIKKEKENAKRFISNRELFVLLPLKFKVAFVQRQDANMMIVPYMPSATHLFHVKLFYNRDEIQCDFFSPQDISRL